MNYLARFFDNTVAQKAVAAATGVGLIGFVVVHMLGNLQIFVGQDALNSYAEKLKSFGAILWIARIGLLSLIVLHIAITVRLSFRNRAARRGKYAVVNRQVSTASSRNMIISGSAILTFVIFHLIHFTFGWVQPDLAGLRDERGRHDVYSMVTLGFENWGIAVFYLVAMICLCSHLSHAIFSAFQSLGLSMVGKDTLLKRVARYVAVATVVGFASVPVAVLLGWFGE